MLTTLVLATSLQTSVLAPGIPPEFQKQIQTTLDAASAYNPEGLLWSMSPCQLLARPGSNVDSIPAAFQTYSDEYCRIVFGKSPKTDWKGYVNPGSDSFGGQFGMATAYNSINRDDIKVIVYCSPAALTFIVPEGSNISDTQEFRTQKLLSILAKYSTFRFDETKVELDPIPMLGDNLLGDLWHRGIRFYLKGRVNNGLRPSIWWAMFSCYTSKDLTVFQFPQYNRVVVEENHLSGVGPALRKPGTGLTPLDEKYWLKDR